MQNKSLLLLGTFFVTTLFTASVTFAQDAKKPQPEKPAQAQDIKIDEKTKQLLDSELSEINTDVKDVIDFPNRSSLGSLELASLPGTKETLITGPAPMEPSVSRKDLPSEQLLGRITPEVFQEMADLERGNVFLKLQMQKEQLKNDLESLKAKYRQARLDEIAKRENVVRSRINWWQDQEKIRLEIEKKKAETEALEQKIEEAEALRDQLRAQAMERAKENPQEVKTVITIEPEKTSAVFADQYALVDIKGVKGVLKARLKNLQDSKLITVQVNDVLPSGHTVKNITKDSIFVIYGNQQNSLTISPVAKSN